MTPILLSPVIALLASSLAQILPAAGPAPAEIAPNPPATESVPTPPDAWHVPAPVGAAPPNSSARPVPALLAGFEWYLGLTYGVGTDTTADVSAEGVTCGPFGNCWPDTKSYRAPFDASRLAGLQVGIWYAYFGLAMEATKYWLSGPPEVEFGMETISLDLMLRLPILRTEAMPGGHVTPYVGYVLSGVAGGEVKINYPDMARPVSGGTAGWGGGPMVGLALKYWRLSLNGEARWISWHVKQQEAELGGPGPVNATLTYRQREYRLGLSWLIIEW